MGIRVAMGAGRFAPCGGLPAVRLTRIYFLSTETRWRQVMWTNQEFWTRADECWNQYRTQEGWFSWGEDTEDARKLAGLKMYRNVTQGKLMPLLGDAKIRQDRTLVMNFGLASGSGSDDQKMIDELNALRRNYARNTSFPALPISGGGSILNDQKWSPLVNDSFILGGIHRGKEFHLALQDFAQFDAGRKEARQVFGAVAPQYAAAKPRGLEQHQQKWKLYLISHPEVLWNGEKQIPRVFARELIGLKAFGYEPDFNAGGLGFRGPVARNAGFSTDLTGLAEAGFRTADKSRIISSVSEFLFGNGNALS
jgi:hypothetical protein